MPPFLHLFLFLILFLLLRFEQEGHCANARRRYGHQPVLVFIVATATAAS